MKKPRLKIKKKFKKIEHVEILGKHSKRAKRYLTVAAVIFLLSFGAFVVVINKKINDDNQAIVMKITNSSHLEQDISVMVKGYPIAAMVPYISRQEPMVAAFLVSIAKQESDWGLHAPAYRGKDCYNYWGFKGINPVGSGGHSCFASPREAVTTVAKRISELINQEKLNTPDKMVVWKCGYTCSGQDRSSVLTWINNVSYYYQKFNQDNVLGKQ